MNAGYVRLSRDDDKQNYVSIENQKLIISQYAQSHGITIDRWYEDDGISGYIFERAGFTTMMNDLNKDIDTIYVKDLSRIGRHNAKVLLLLDEFRENGKRLIAIDDNYDSSDSNSEDIIGIKTWYNEVYVKDTSRKIRHAIGARQKNGTLVTQPPFGYKRNAQSKSAIEIVSAEAINIKMIYKLYISGLGYRKISDYLTEQNIPTPSMVQHEREIQEGRLSKKSIASRWSDGMVKDILDNDFYIGTLRFKKTCQKYNPWQRQTGT